MLEAALVIADSDTLNVSLRMFQVVSYAATGHGVSALLQNAR